MSVAAIKREIKMLQHAFQLEEPDRMVFDWERVPKEVHDMLVECSRIYLATRPNYTCTHEEYEVIFREQIFPKLSSEEQQLFIRWEHACDKYLEPESVLKREKRGQWRSIH